MYRASPDVVTSFYATVQSERDLFEFASNSHPRTRRGDVLTNIPEEDSAIDDEPRTFEQDEKYLNECLKGFTGSTEDVINVGDAGYEIEEYDFDDYNSIASSVSLLNIASDGIKEEGNSLEQRLPTQKVPTVLKKSPFLPVVENTDISPDLHDVLRQKEVTRRRNSIAKVYDWEKLGTSEESAGDPQLALLNAAERGDVHVIQEVCQNVNGSVSEFLLKTVDSQGNTAVHKSSLFGNLSCLQWLVSQLPDGAISLCNHEGLTATALAIQNGHLSCVRWLVEEVHDSDDIAMTPLLKEAARAGKDDILRYLLLQLKKNDNSLANMHDRDGPTPAHLAAREGHLLCLQSLVENGIDVTVRDKDGLTPADYAHKTCQTGCYRYLVVVESCWLLAARVAKQHHQLSTLKDENSELRRRLEVLERQLPAGLPNRSEADGGDQSDSTSNDSRSAEPGQKFQKVRFKDAAPDGQSPKHYSKDTSLFNYQMIEHPVYGKKNVRSKPEGEVILSSKIDEKNNPYELSRLIRRRASIDSQEGGTSVTQLSFAEMLRDAPDSEKAMAKQIASTTHRLLLSRHARMPGDSRRPGLNDLREEDIRKPHRTEPLLKATVGRKKESQPLLPLQYLTRVSKAAEEEHSRTFIKDHDSFSNNQSCRSNEKNSQGFPINPSSCSSKSNSPILLSSSSRESSSSSSPVLRTNAVRGRLEPTIANSDSTYSGSSDSEHEHKAHKRFARRNVQSDSRSKNYKLTTGVSPTMKSDTRYGMQNGFYEHNSASSDSPNPAPVNKRDPTSKGITNQETTKMAASENKRKLTQTQVTKDNHKYNDAAPDLRKSSHPGFYSGVDKSSFISKTMGLATRGNTSVLLNSTPGENTRLQSQSSEKNRLQRTAPLNDTITPSRGRTNGCYVETRGGSPSPAKALSSNSLHHTTIDESRKNNRHNIVWSPKDFAESITTSPTQKMLSSSKITETDTKQPQQRTVPYFNEQVSQRLTFDNSQTEDRPWYEIEDWE